MEEKSEQSLDRDALKMIGHNLIKADLNSWSITSTNLYGFFSGERPSPSYWLNQFLICVAHGEQKKAEELLKMKGLSLLVQEGEFSDYSKRQFNTSAFKYILAALDTRYMFAMFLSCLQEAKIPLQEKKIIAIELARQYEEFMKNGITYTLDAQTHENQNEFGFDPLKRALMNYAFNYYKHGDMTRSEYFCTDVGKAQMLVPAHLAQHYCELNVSFDKTTFTTETFERSLDVRDANGDILHKWWACEGDLILGQNCGYTVGDNSKSATVGIQLDRDGAVKNVDTIYALWEQRLQDRLAIKVALNSLIKELNKELGQDFDDENTNEKSSTGCTII